jgi:hypothetical protein
MAIFGTHYGIKRNSMTKKQQKLTSIKAYMWQCHKKTKQNQTLDILITSYKHSCM